MLWSILLAIIWIIFLWDAYLAIRQYRVHRDAVVRPEDVKDIISEEEYRKARLYKLDKHRFNLLCALYAQLECTAVFVLNLISVFWTLSGSLNERLGLSGEIFHSITFVIVVGIIEAFLSFPWQAFDVFVIEGKHGFNKQTFGFFVKDGIKKLIISMLISAAAIGTVVYIIRNGGPYFFVYTWLFISAVTFILLTVYPEFIAPLFDKYVPLPESELRQKIEKLAASVNYPLKKLFVVEGSKRSAHSNAYMYGFWKNKRIVLFDTLLTDEMYAKVKESCNGKYDENECNNQKQRTGLADCEVLAVLGHEIGHWALSHTLFNLLLVECNLLLTLFAFSFFYQEPSLYHAFGFDDKPAFIGLVIIFQYIAAPYNEVLNFMITVISRRNEFAADQYSTKLGYGGELCSALVKLGKNNLSMPIDDPLYSMFNHSHPPILERIAAIRRKER